MNPAISPELVKALAVTAELTGTELSKVAARVFAEDLATYPLPQVLGALTRCRREVKGRLTLADVVTRLDDGRPGAEEAWAMFPKHERDSAIVCDEMATAYGAAKDHIERGDMIGGRMAFIEVYRREIQKSRDAGTPVRWWPSLGDDQSGRAAAIVEARDRLRITSDKADRLMLQHAPAIASEAQAGLALAGPQPVGRLVERLVAQQGASR